MRKYLPLMIVLASLLLSSASAFAAYDEFYTTDSSGSTTHKDTFHYNDDVYLYAKLPHAGTNLNSIFLNGPNGDFYSQFSGPSAATEYWFNLGSSFSALSDAAKRGVWNVDGLYGYAGVPLDFGTNNTTFTVNPEPATATLFALGGLGLIATKLRRKKLAAV